MNARVIVGVLRADGMRPSAIHSVHAGVVEMQAAPKALPAASTSETKRSIPRKYQ
jgi:hypothetical protein